MRRATAGLGTQPLRIPWRSLWQLWGEQQVIDWSGSGGPGEEVVVRAMVARHPRSRLPAYLITTTERRLLLIWGWFRYARLISLRRELVRVVRVDPKSDFPISIGHLLEDGGHAFLQLRPFSYGKLAANTALNQSIGTVGSVMAGAVGQVAAEVVADGVGDALDDGLGASESREIAATVAAGLGMSSPRPLPRDFVRWTWRSLLVFPGFGLLTLLALVALPFTVHGLVEADVKAAAFHSLPRCSADLTTNCLLSREAVLEAMGDGRHPDGGVAEGQTWFLLHFPDGSSRVVDLGSKVSATDISPGARVRVESVNQRLTTVATASIRWDAYDSPNGPVTSGGWLLLLDLLFLVLAGVNTFWVGVKLWQQRRIRWAPRSWTPATL